MSSIAMLDKPNSQFSLYACDLPEFDNDRKMQQERRCTNVKDIPIQIIRAAFSPIHALHLAANNFLATPIFLCSGKGKRAAKEVFLGIATIAAIPADLLLRVGTVIASTIGVISPNVGSFARRATLLKTDEEIRRVANSKISTYGGLQFAKKVILELSGKENTDLFDRIIINRTPRAERWAHQLYLTLFDKQSASDSSVGSKKGQQNAA